MKLTLLEYFDIVIREGHKKSVYDCPSLVDTELSAMVRGFSDVTRRLGDVTFYAIEMGPKRKPRKGDEDARKRQQIERRRELQMARLERETKYGAITLARQEKNWERMLTEAALPRMRDDLTYAWRCFERAVDCKDFAIGLLMDELDEAERHRFLNATAHSEHIDRIIDGFGARVRELDREFAEEIKRVMDERVATLSDARSSSRENEDHLKTALHILEMATKEVRRTRRADYFSKLEEQASKDAQLVEQCAAVLEEIRLRARDATVAFVDRYRDRTRERKNADDKLKKRDDRLQATIAKRLDAIRAASDRARALRVARAEQRAYFERKLADLRGERDFFLAAFDALKRKLARDRAADFERAARLAACHDDVATRLGDVRARAERVLRLGATCRRLETLEVEKPIRSYITYIAEVTIESIVYR
ncbi:dynein regulatory complex subunit 2-like [Cylas formicarius]|uniref:dynein regulatory complex subunit 2-like n=1 Tax=Cylas formicarius TaxID=197179 RepID=UPI0029585695|nr:dynein regulatory complex subunit 2-like [Cylas formicarius]